MVGTGSPRRISISCSTDPGCTAYPGSGDAHYLLVLHSFGTKKAYVQRHDVHGVQGEGILLSIRRVELATTYTEYISSLTWDYLSEGAYDHHVEVAGQKVIVECGKSRRRA